MFEAFSRGYYLGRLYVEPAADGRAAIGQRLHETVTERLYTDAAADDDGASDPPPPVMKLGRTHFVVHGAADVPGQTLAVPEAIAAECDRLPALEEVFLAKPDRARQLLSYATGTVSTDRPGTATSGDGVDPT